MENTAYTIRMFMPSGSPTSLKIIDKMNWTGLGIEVSREDWPIHRNREVFSRSGIYILTGFEKDDLPTIYIGQGDTISNRLEWHWKNKDFWNRALVFVSSNNSLNRAHITWLEWALIQTATKANRSILDNSVDPNEPTLSEFEKADVKQFLSEILSILPLVELKVFQLPQKINIDEEKPDPTNLKTDTIIVPAQEEGFKEVFLGENCWYAIRIGGGKLNQIKYIAVYQTAPISAVTYLAEVESIEPYGEDKYKLNFKAPAEKIEPIVYGDAKLGTMQSPRYTTLEKLKAANQVSDLF